MYAPVVLINGRLASTLRRVHRLNDYLPQDLVDNPYATRAVSHLLKAPTVDKASEANAVVIGFADSASGALVQIEISTPATELSELAGSLADFLASTNLCRRIQTEGTSAITSVSQAARHHIVIVGVRILSQVLDQLANDVKHLLLSQAAALCEDGGLTSVSSAARHHIVIVGARSQEGGLLDDETAGVGYVFLLAAQRVGVGYVWHLGRLQVKSVRPAPIIGPGRPTVFVSPEGTGAVVVWENGSSLTWVGTDPATGEWSEPFSLPVDEALSRADAYLILRQRARSLD